MALVLIGCAPFAASDPVPGQATPGSPRAARLSIVGSGSVSCTMAHACLASFAVAPGGLVPGPDWEPTAGAAMFDLERAPDVTAWTVRPTPRGAPSSLAEGRHTLIAAVSEMSDVSSLDPAGNAVRAFLWTQTCSADVTVGALTATVQVEIQFTDGNCVIAAQSR
jgi:hypothetical protein